MRTLLKTTAVASALAAGAFALPATAAGLGVPDKSGIAAGESKLTEHVHWGYRRYHRPRFYFYVGPGYHRPYYHYRSYHHYRPYRHYYHRHWW